MPNITRPESAIPSFNQAVSQLSTARLDKTKEIDTACEALYEFLEPCLIESLNEVMANATDLTDPSDIKVAIELYELEPPTAKYAPKWVHSKFNALKEVVGEDLYKQLRSSGEHRALLNKRLEIYVKHANPTWDFEVECDQHKDGFIYVHLLMKPKGT